MRTYEIKNKKGSDLEPIEIEKTNILKLFGVHSRDLRPIVSHRQIATIFRRDKAIIVNINDIKIILDKNQALFFCDAEQKQEKIAQFFREKMNEYEKKLQFELYLIDKAFSYMFTQATDQFEAIRKQTQTTIKKLSIRPTDEYLEKLLLLKKRLNKLENHVEEYEKILAEFLEEENLPQLLLSAKPTEKKIDEVESVIENLAEQAEQINHQIDELSDNLDDSQEILSLKIANKRNTIIRFDLMVSFVAAIFGFMAVIVGLYGMNIRNNLEDDHTAFVTVATGLLIMLVLALVVMWAYFRRNKIL